MSPLSWPLTGNIFFFYFFNYFYKLYIAIIDHKQVLCLSKEEWFTYDTTSFLHLINHIQNQKKRCKKKKWWTQTAHHGISSHHLQTFSLFLFLLCVALICFDPCREGRAVQSLRSAPARLCAALNRMFPGGSVPLGLTSDCKTNTCKPLFLHPACNCLSLLVRCSAKWSQNNI